MRASYSSPSYSLLARIGPLAVSFQLSSLATDIRLPSSYSTFELELRLGIAEIARADRRQRARRVVAAVAQHHADGVPALRHLFA